MDGDDPRWFLLPGGERGAVPQNRRLGSDPIPNDGVVVGVEIDRLPYEGDDLSPKKTAAAIRFKSEPGRQPFDRRARIER